MSVNNLNNSNNFMFKNIYQALRVSYLMEIIQSSVISSLTMIQKANYAYTFHHKNNNINFDGLNELEIHAQCAIIRNIVEKQLPLLLSNIIIAKYSANDIFINKIYKDSKIKRKIIQAPSHKRITAISNIANEIYLIVFKDKHKNIPFNLVEILTFHAFDKSLLTQQQMSILQLAKEFNLPKSNLYYYLNKITEFIKEKETNAIENLIAEFERKLIIPGKNKKI